MIPKFRAWNKTTSKLHVVNGIYCDNKKIHYIDDNRVRFVGFDNVIIMQSTDLRDDNGKEIFEGDVIFWTYWDEFEDSGRAKIIFDKGMFKLLDIHTEKEVWDSLSDCIENCNVYLQGNVYENSELLEVEE